MKTGMRLALPLLACLSMLAQEDSQPQDFGGSYVSLRPEQKPFIDDWFHRLSEVLQTRVDPSEGYDSLPLSAKTTFNAVTHALLMTKLTDQAGNSLADSAIALVGKVDTVAGEVLGERGDRQFRMYVQTAPDVIGLLNRSQEFRRSADNTVYHKGYPISYRSSGTPSIQVSLTRDATRADIDVDYRSSRFPTALVNGHLTASNSDVRAGNNDQRHNQQWAGLQNWWRNLLGLPFTESTGASELLPDQPVRKDSKPADAIFDFLNVWLVEQRPNESLAYFDNEAFACLGLEEGTAVDYGVVRFSALRNMIAANEKLGKVASLGDVTRPVLLSGDRVKWIRHPNQTAFALYQVREDLAEEFKCSNERDSANISTKAMKSRDFRKYVGAVFEIRESSRLPRTVATLWQRENGYWKLISYKVDPDVNRTVPTTIATPPEVAPLPYVEGDKDMIAAASEFLEQWFMRKNIDRAMQYLAPETLACAGLYQDDAPRPSSPEESRRVIRNGLQEVARVAGSVGDLEDAIVAPEVHHHDLKLVRHRHDRAFVIASIPDAMGDAVQCANRQPGERIEFSEDPANSGKFYAAGFSLNEGPDNPAVLWTVWNKSGDEWKITSYVLLTP